MIGLWDMILLIYTWFIIKYSFKDYVDTNTFFKVWHLCELWFFPRLFEISFYQKHYLFRVNLKFMEDRFYNSLYELYKNLWKLCILDDSNAKLDSFSLTNLYSNK